MQAGNRCLVTGKACSLPVSAGDHATRMIHALYFW